MPMERTPHAPAAEPGTPEFFLEVAERIAARVARDAHWEDDTATWEIMSPDRENPASRTAKPSLASGTLYEGTAGIGLFLAETWAATGRRDDEMARAAEGAIRFALKDGANLPESSFGLHGGRVGVAYAAGRAAALLDRPEFLAAALDILRPMEGKEELDRGVDVIAGGGGAIPALLRLAEWTGDELPVGIAKRLGDNLLESAEREPGGWAWGTMRGSAIRHLCGYAHGSAGVGHGLLELWRATGDGAYLYGMEQAFLYERQFFSPEASNWPDLRHSELGDYLYQNRQEELRERLLRGEPIAPQQPRYMSAWCHGGPGIGLTRLRAWQVLQDPFYLDEARAALQATRQSLIDPRMNYSICHGQGGNAETLIYGAEVLGEDELFQEAARVAVRGWEEYEQNGRAWPCGTLGAVADPGLLLGESGIGYFFLRLGRPETPSVAFVVPGGQPAVQPDDTGYLAWQRRAVSEYFGRTLRIFRELGEPVEQLDPERAPGQMPQGTDVEQVYERIAAHVAAQTDPARRELLDDAFRVDRERYELGRSVTDFTEEFTAQLVRQPEDEVQWQDARMGLSPRARVVYLTHDWEGWLEREESDAGPPEEDDVFYLVQVSGQRGGTRRLSPFAAVVLQAVEQPAGLDEVVDRLVEAVSGGNRGVDRGWVEDRVVEQLRQAYRAGFITAESHAVPAAA